MDAQRFDTAIVQPKPLRVVIPLRTTSDDEEAEWQARYPSPPPPTPSYRNPRGGTPLDEQRYDPFRAMLSATSPPRYASPNPEYLSSYPELADSAVYRLPAVEDAYDELLAYHLGSNGAGDDSDELSAESDDTTPTDECGHPVEHSTVTTYQFEGASEDGDYVIERTIVRPVPRRFDLTKSLATLATRSTATLRQKASFSYSSEDTTPSSSTEDSDDYDTVVVPPTSRATSRRPSLAVSAFPITEVTDRLKRLATHLVPARYGADDHFEETVEHYEEVWAREERGEPQVEVLVTRTQESFVDAAPYLNSEIVSARRYVGLYANGAPAPAASRA
ncbi:hypothetical protein ONZ51_g12898 [Trametes cubensis]|uniref:Uncharacterized protein n=1 Tax=Trametes cubensis TaxID=1111947 RepID=A0AAD7X4I6_9APHY|nr:hypothetical protein ONZ51_g12898 [Trametes cubensis]